jgi:hypothetical protein
MMRGGTASSARSFFAFFASNGLAREHQVKRGRRADQLRQAFDTTPRRQDAKHHFGQAHARAGIVDRHTVAAGHCQLQAATHAEALDQGKGRVFHAARRS